MIEVWVTDQFVGHHRWKEAPEAVSFLRGWHRHVFHVKVGVGVGHGDREVEFFQFKSRLRRFIRSKFEGARFDYSCEDIGHCVLEALTADWVEVSEDGENGAKVTRDQDRLPAWEKKGKCFIGREAEGPRSGLWTLFVPGCASPDVFRKLFDRVRLRVEAVYYGAGNDRKLRMDTLATIKRILGQAACHGYVLTIEDESSITVNGQRFRKEETETEIIWIEESSDREYRTMKNDSLYRTDFYVDVDVE